jgi:ankyrin repeat protein
MRQPDALKSDDWQPWSHGRGTDVWTMLSAAAAGDLERIKSLVSEQPDLVQCSFEYRKPLHFAVRENRLDVVEFLLDHGADPTEQVSHDPPVTIARDRGHREMAALLESRVSANGGIAAGEEIAELIRSRNIERVLQAIEAKPALIDAADMRGNQPIHWAVMTRQLRLIDALLDRGADIKARRPDGARPLDLTNGDYYYRGWRDVPADAIRPHAVLIGYLIARGAEYDISVAAKIGDIDRVRNLLDEHPELVNQSPPYASFYSGLPLRCAAGAGHLEIVRLLLERGADPNGQEPMAPHGGALHSAIGAQHYECAKLLLEHGANPNAAVDSSGNCMWFARKDPELAKLVASYGGVITLELACYDGDAAVVGAMLHANPQMPIDEASVHNAMENGHRHVLELILRYQPDILRQMRLGDPATPELARWLMNQGSDPNRTNWLAIAPLHRLAAAGKRELAAVCLEFGADINAIDDEYSSTPLGWAARAGKQDMVRWLLAQGADRDLPRDEPWARPLEWARRRGHHEIAAQLST